MATFTDLATEFFGDFAWSNLNPVLSPDLTQQRKQRNEAPRLPRRRPDLYKRAPYAGALHSASRYLRPWLYDAKGNRKKEPDFDQYLYQASIGARPQLRTNWHRRQRYKRRFRRSKRRFPYNRTLRQHLHQALAWRTASDLPRNFRWWN